MLAQGYVNVELNYDEANPFFARIRSEASEKSVGGARRAGKELAST